MSHFSCLVIGENPDAQLAPYHEYECTKITDYVQEIDITEKTQKEYDESTSMVVEATDGELYSLYNRRFYRKLTPEEQAQLKAGVEGVFQNELADGTPFYKEDWDDGDGYIARVLSIPEGWIKKEVPSHKFISFREWLKKNYDYEAICEEDEPDTSRDGFHEFGYCIIDNFERVIKVVNRTNPNAKWDCYEIGGRWSGFFPLKEGSVGLVHGEKPDTADQLLKKDVDFEHARQEAVEQANEQFDAWEACFTEHERPKGWEELADDDLQKAKEVYKAQPCIKVWFATGAYPFDCPVDVFGFDRDAYVQKCINSTLVPFAVVKDGKWYARGKMGWFGCVSDEMSQAQWCEQVQRLYEDLPDDTMLTLVNCHC